MSSALGAEQLLLLPLLLLSTKYLIVKVCHAEQRKVATTNDDDAAATNFLALPKKKIVKMSPAPWNPEPVSLATDQQQEFHQHSKFKSIPMRPSPIVHPAVDAPICPECQALEMTFFNPDCKGCQYELETMAHHGIGIASIFAILRQWIPQVRHFHLKISHFTTLQAKRVSFPF